MMVCCTYCMFVTAIICRYLSHGYRYSYVSTYDYIISYFSSPPPPFNVMSCHPMTISLGVFDWDTIKRQQEASGSAAPIPTAIDLQAGRMYFIL